VGSEKGSILLAVSVIFLIIGLLLLSVLELASIERKMSRNYTDLLQARQAVDGGVARTCQLTLSSLQAGAGAEALPGLPVGANTGSQVIGDPSGQVSYRIRGEGVKLAVQGSNYGIYAFSCEGSSHGVVQTASVKVRYGFSNIYKYTSGYPLFDHRIFNDQGRVTYYQLDK